MAPHSSTLAWKIPWTEEPGRLQSTGLLRVGHDWVTSLSLSCIGEGNGNPLQCSCLENPRDGGAWCVAVYGVTQSWTWLKWLSSSSCSSKGIYPVVGLLGHSFAPSFFFKESTSFFCGKMPSIINYWEMQIKNTIRYHLTLFSVSCSVMPDSLWPLGLQPTRLISPWDFPGKDTGVGCHFHLQGIFPTQGLNPGTLHCRQILYRLSYKVRMIIIKKTPKVTSGKDMEKLELLYTVDANVK